MSHLSFFSYPLYPHTPLSSYPQVAKGYSEEDLAAQEAVRKAAREERARQLLSTSRLPGSMQVPVYLEETAFGGGSSKAKRAHNYSSTRFFLVLSACFTHPVF